MAIGQGNNLENDLGKQVSLPHTRVRVPDKQTCKKKLIRKTPGAECVAFANHKGGTGKTTSCLSIAGYPDSDLLKKARGHGPLLIMIKTFTADGVLQAIPTSNKRPQARIELC